jgi:hypothetical protein
VGISLYKYTSYAISDHQAANVIQPVVFVFILFHDDNEEFDVRQQWNVHDITHIDRCSINQPLIF